MRLAIRLNACYRMRNIGIAIDHVALIDDNGRDFRDPGTPCISDVLIGVVELLGNGVGRKSRAHFSRRLSWIGRQISR